MPALCRPLSYALPCGALYTMSPELLTVLLPTCALLCGGALGYTLAWAQGRAVLRAHLHAEQLQHERALMREANRGGPCWVRGVAPPGVIDRGD